MTRDDERPVDGIELDEDVETTVVRMWGAVDGNLRGQASAAMARCLERGRAVVIDVSGTTFMDSSGLAFLLQLHRVGQEEGMPVVLRDAPAFLTELLQMIGMADVVPLTWSSGREPGAGDDVGDVPVLVPV